MMTNDNDDCDINENYSDDIDDCGDLDDDGMMVILVYDDYNDDIDNNIVLMAMMMVMMMLLIDGGNDGDGCLVIMVKYWCDPVMQPLW